MKYDVVEIGKEFFLIKSPEEELHRNIYLKRFIGQNNEKINMLMDPGTTQDYPNLLKILNDMIGGPKNLDLIFLSHQDPDVSSNIGALLIAAKKAKVIASIDSWRLVQMYGIPQKKFLSVENFKYNVLKVYKTNHWIQFVPATFCHFRGAVMFYDFESKVLFTGDFLAGVDSRKGEGVYATEDSWHGISMFHQIYMPSKRAIEYTVNKISVLDPYPEIIAPQHGDVIKGDFVKMFLSRISVLQVGDVLLDWDSPEQENLILSFNEFISILKTNQNKIFELIKSDILKSGEFTSTISFSGDTIKDIKLIPREAVLYILNIIKKVSTTDTLDEIYSYFVMAINKYGIELPPEAKIIIEKEPETYDELEDLLI